MRRLRLRVCGVLPLATAGMGACAYGIVIGEEIVPSTQGGHGGTGVTDGEGAGDGKGLGGSSLGGSPVGQAGAGAGIVDPSGGNGGTGGVGEASNGGAGGSGSTTGALGFSEMVVGSYIGNGTTNRNITVALLAPSFVIVQNNDGGEAAWVRTKSMTGTLSKPMGAQAAATGRIQALGSGFFQVSASPGVNASQSAYVYAAFGGPSSEVKVGSYVGTGTGGSVALGFSPGQVMVLPRKAEATLHRSTFATETRAANGTAHGDALSLTTAGFNHALSADITTDTYDYVALSAAHIDAGVHAGTGAATVIPTTVQPKWVWFQRNDALSPAAHHVATGGWDTFEVGGVGTATNAITSVSAAGFAIGDSSLVNAPGGSYVWASFGSP